MRAAMGALNRRRHRVRPGLLLRLLVRGLVLVLPLLLITAAQRPARAHEMRPALLSVTQVARDDYDVDLRVPVEVAVRAAPVPIFPPGSEQRGGTSRTREGGSELQTFRVRIPGGLSGRRLAVQFAPGTAGEVLVRVVTLDGRTGTGRMVPRPGEPSVEWVVPAEPRPLMVVRTYVLLGVQHILGGFDHLAFVLGLVLLAPSWRRLWKSVTSFTAAHSLTLALAALGVVRVPPPPVEAAIALSIVLVAREVWLVQCGVRPARAAWPMAFAFGLLHGLGFAGALSEIGLPANDIPLALFAFNIGVEIGQLSFVVVILVAIWLAARALAHLPPARRARLRLAPAYLIGVIAAFWCLQRIALFAS